MLKQFPIKDLIAAIQDRIQTGTDLPCYDYVEDNQSSPFVFVEFIGTQPDNTKTMYVTNYEIMVHIIAEPSPSSVPILGYIQEVQEAMTEDITIPDPYLLLLQTDNGIQTLKTDETDEKHAILSYQFKIAYGYMMK